MNPSVFEVSLFGTSSHEVESQHCPPIFLQVGTFTWDKKQKKERKKKRKSLYPMRRVKSLLNIQYAACCSIGRTLSLCGSPSVVSSSPAPQLSAPPLCNILNNLRVPDTTWVTVRSSALLLQNQHGFRQFLEGRTKLKSSHIPYFIENANR